MSGLILHARTAVFLIVSLSSIACYGADLDAELQSRILKKKEKDELVSFLADTIDLCILDDQFRGLETIVYRRLFSRIERLPDIKRGDFDFFQILKVYEQKIGNQDRFQADDRLLKQRIQRIYSTDTIPENVFTFKQLKTDSGLRRIKQLHARVSVEFEKNKTFEPIYNLVSVNLIASLIANGLQAQANGLWQQLDQKKYSVEWIQNFSLTLITELADPKKK
jgi:hypothetical protein